MLQTKNCRLTTMFQAWDIKILQLFLSEKKMAKKKSIPVESDGVGDVAYPLQ